MFINLVALSCALHSSCFLYASSLLLSDMTMTLFMTHSNFKDIKM